MCLSGGCPVGKGRGGVRSHGVKERNNNIFKYILAKSQSVCTVQRKKRGRKSLL